MSSIAAHPFIQAIIPACDEESTIGIVLDGLPVEVGGVPLRAIVVDDGSRDRTASRARAAGARVISHGSRRGLGAALRTGIEAALAAGCVAAVYLDADGEYAAAEASRLLEPVLRGEVDYVLGSRFLGERLGMARHRAASNRTLSACLNLATGLAVTDWQTGFRAFSPRALTLGRIRHDYNSAQVLTLSLWSHGIEPFELPISYRRRTHGRSFIRHREYLRRVAPAVAAEYKAGLGARRIVPRRFSEGWAPHSDVHPSRNAR